MSFCRWPDVMGEGVQSYSTMAQGGREGNTLRDSDISSYFFFSSRFPFLSLFLFSRRGEGPKERMADGAQGYRGAQGRPSIPNPSASVVKWLGPLRRSKGPGKLSLPISCTPRSLHQLQQQGIQKPYHQQAPQWLGGLLKLRVRRRNPIDRSEPLERPERGMK
jgi:hypothetical protein